MKKIWIYFLACACYLPASAQQNIAAINEQVRKANPGDTIIIPNGIYQNAALVFSGKGTAAHPVVVKAATPGQVILSGNSYLKVSGEYLIVNGLFFNKGFTTKEPVIEFRKNNQELANHCRVTNTVISDYSKPERFNTDSWIVFWGKENRLDHSTIGDKLNGGTTLIVNLDDERSQHNFHSIDSNYFAGHSRLGSNGGETIRVGVSRYSLTSSNTNIHHNLFEYCNGEVEIISIKSGENVISRNTFFECEGGMVLRHGSKNTIEGNIFIGNNKPYTGGVRVINPGHQVYNNLFVDLAGERFRSALGVLNGVPNSALNRYFQVKDARIHHNSFINCANIIFGAGKDAERTLPPSNVTFDHNYIQAIGKQLYEDANKDGGVLFSNNKYTGNATAAKGFTVVKPAGYFTKRIHGQDLRLPVVNGAGAALDKLDWIDEGTGATWFEAIDSVVAVPGVITVAPADAGKLQQVIDKADDGATIELLPAQYKISSPIVVNKRLHIRSSDTLHGRAELVNVSERSLPAFIVIENWGDLTIEGIRFNSAFESYGDVQSAISTTTKPMNRHYTLTVNDCEFINFNETNYSCIKGTRSTYADLVTITNSVFRNNSGASVEFAAEKEDKGIYNVEELRISNCVFSNNLNTAINVYRGGNDESTTGPTVIIDQCTFNEVDNREQGCVIKLIGVQRASITNSIFNKSGAGGRVVWFEEMSWDNIRVDYCNLYESGRIGSFYNKAAGAHIYHIRPDFTNAAAFRFNLKPGSALSNKSSKGKTIGAYLP